MKIKSASQSAFFNMRVLIGFMSLAGIFVALVLSNAFAQVKGKGSNVSQAQAPAWAPLADLHGAAAPASRTAAPDQHIPTLPSTDVPSPEPPANCTWVADTMLPTNIMDQAVTSVGSNLYTFAGVGNGAIVASSFKFDGTTWTPIAAYPVATEWPSACSDGTNAYIMNGVSTGPVYQTTLNRYNVAGNTYTALAPNTVAVWNASAVFKSGKIYKMGGFDSADVQRTELEIYDIAGNAWTMGAPIPTGKGFASAWVQGNFIYLAGGISADVGTNAAYRYDIAGNSWSAIANLPATRWGATSDFYGDSGVLAGGYVGGDAATNVSATAIYYNATGNTWISLPDMVISRARMNGAARGGSFYVIGGRPNGDTGFTGSNNNQKLTCAFQPIVIQAAGSTLGTEGCNPPNTVIDPGETVTVSFCVRNIGTQNTANLMGTLQATGGVTNPSGPQNYGVVTAGGAAVCRNFTFTANGTCGGTITATIHFQDGLNNLGDVTYTFTLGVKNVTVAFSENFDGVTPPALPAMWTADQGTNASGFPMWVTSNSGVPTPVADTAPNSAFSPDPNNLLDNRIYSPTVMYPANAQLMFRQNYDIEQADAATAYDAGVLEISVNGGAYMDIVTAGGTFTSGGYNHTALSTAFANPLLADRCPGGVCGNWSGISNGGAGGFETVMVNLPAADVGMPVKFRWRMGSDNSVSHNGWRIDTVKITTSNFICCGSAPTVVSAVSNKTHGAAGTFGIALPLTGTTGVECRTGGMTNDFTIKVTFSGNVSVTGSPQAQVISGTGTVGSGGVSNGGMVTVMGSMVTIPLTNVTDQQTTTVRLNGVNSATSDAPAVDVSIPMSRLLGDSNGNRAVNASDVTQTKGRIGQAVTSVNFRSDINVNGSINSADASQVKANSGHGVP